ncbi:hypothetical protein E3N88_32889 [Mikania micrantha]|uniref:Uncharacterized protein n=1 Tax=Mikania micrantha TaxID=192012 RepID=A0A5N6M9P5_9ASTR|nr:hypothetical protein E3N88_32889 [Mikania micrantha]
MSIKVKDEKVLDMHRIIKGLIRLEERRRSHVLIATKKEDRRIAGKKKASAIARLFPGKKNRSRNRPNGLTETDRLSPGKKEDRRL